VGVAPVARSMVLPNYVGQRQKYISAHAGHKFHFI